MAELLLAVNAGSSSIKFALYEKGVHLACRARGAIIGMEGASTFHVQDCNGKSLAEESWQGRSYDAILAALLDWIENHLGADRLAGVGHRIVHGGERFTHPIRLEAETLALLELLSPQAPLHQPQGLSAARALTHLCPGVPQIACFDTAFHLTMPACNRRYGLPRELEAEGIRKFGFHGLSFEYIAGRLKEIAPQAVSGRIIVAHLGSGASLCALKDGRSIDTSMGYSPLDGLIMATRCGALDPGILLHLVREGVPADVLEDLLYRRSGLLGVSGLSGDMRTLLASSDPRAGEAVELFVVRLAREIAAMAASLKGLDGLVFTAGIGENAPEIRCRAAEQLAWLGLTLDSAANEAGNLAISTPDSRIACWVIPTDEEQVIAHHTLACLG